MSRQRVVAALRRLKGVVCLTERRTDAPRRGIAVRLARQFVHWAKGLGPSYRFRSYSDVKHGLGLLIRGKDAGWQPPYDNTEIVVHFRPGGAASASTWFRGEGAQSSVDLSSPYAPTEELGARLRRAHAAQKAGHPPDVRDVNFLKAFIVSVAREETLTHELTHVIDNMRIGPRGQRIKRPGADDRAAYMNSPLEMNAYFQQAAAEVDKSFEYVLAHGDAEDVDYEVVRYPFRDYKKFFLDSLHPGVWENLTAKNKRRFLKRIAGSYKELQAAGRKRIRELRTQRQETA